LALMLAAITAFRGGDLGEVAALVQHGWDQGRLLASGFDRWLPWSGLTALVVSDKLGFALELSDALLANASAHGEPIGLILYNGCRGWIEARQGHRSFAEAGLRAALTGLHARRFTYQLRLNIWYASEVMLERPQATDLAALAEELEIGPAAAVHSGALALEARGRLRHAAGDVAAGIQDLRRAGATFEALEFTNPAGTNWRSALALMLLADEPGEALQLALA
jgi:hypothetical protein